jgi:hypothetical protein
MTPAFQGEVQFRRWSDSSTQGVQITFALPDSSDLEPLKHKAGKRFMAVLVEIGDDEQPVQAPQPRKDTRGPLCREACDYCETPEFQTWVAIVGGHKVATAACAKQFILDRCQIGSRKELDTYEPAQRAFVRDIRIPFFAWNRERKYA